MEITHIIDDMVILSAVADSEDPLKFIIDLDEYIADEGFTIDLMSRLAQAMAREYEVVERQYTEQLLNTTFGDDQASSPWAPKPSHLEQVTKQRRTMEEVIALLKDIT